MARQKAISLLQAAATKADLKEIYGIVIDNVQKGYTIKRFKITSIHELNQQRVALNSSVLLTQRQKRTARQEQH